MQPSVWRFAPDAAKQAWRVWIRQTQMDNTSEAFMAGALWALSESGNGALAQEIRTLKQALREKRVEG